MNLTFLYLDLITLARVRVNGVFFHIRALEEEVHNDQANRELEAQFLSSDILGGALVLSDSEILCVESHIGFQVYDLGLERISLFCISSCWGGSCGGNSFINLKFFFYYTIKQVLRSLCWWISWEDSFMPDLLLKLICLLRDLTGSHFCVLLTIYISFKDEFQIHFF